MARNVEVIVVSETLRISPDEVKQAGDRFTVDSASGQLTAWLHFGQVQRVAATSPSPMQVAATSPSPNARDESDARDKRPGRRPRIPTA